ncbi:MAG: hypothetical protein QGF59_32235, partial [Pirellulaceae bacterium]|nr:hypothetical protein [Pirellulaceae bacterium]
MSHPLRLVSGIALTLIAATAQAQLPAARLTSIFPPGANPGKTVEVTVTGVDLDNATTLYFSAPGITAKQKMAEPGPFDQGPVPVANTFEVTVAANVPGGVYDARVVGKYGTSNPRAFLISDQPVALEAEPNNKREEATEVELPALLSGQS